MYLDKKKCSYCIYVNSFYTPTFFQTYTSLRKNGGGESALFKIIIVCPSVVFSSFVTFIILLQPTF